MKRWAFSVTLAFVLLLGLVIGWLAHSGSGAGNGSASTPTTYPTTPALALGQPFPYTGGLVITLTQVVSPAAPSVAGLSAPPGQHYVAVWFTARDTATSAVTVDADNWTSIVGSDDITYSWNAEELANCPDNPGGTTIDPGTFTKICSDFQLPNGVTPSRVIFSPNDSAVASWNV